MIRNRNKCLLSKAVVDRESIWSNLFLSRSRCQLFIPTGGRAAFLIKEKGGVENIQRNEAYQGMQGENQNRYSRSEFKTKQQGTLCCAAGAKQVHARELIFSFTSMHACFRLLYLVLSSSLMTCYTGSCIFDGENSIISVLLTFSYGF